MALRLLPAFTTQNPPVDQNHPTQNFWEKVINRRRETSCEADILPVQHVDLVSCLPHTHTNMAFLWHIDETSSGYTPGGPLAPWNFGSWGSKTLLTSCHTWDRLKMNGEIFQKAVREQSTCAFMPLYCWAGERHSTFLESSPNLLGRSCAMCQNFPRQFYVFSHHPSSFGLSAGEGSRRVWSSASTGRRRRRKLIPTHGIIKITPPHTQ